MNPRKSLFKPNQADELIYKQVDLKFQGNLKKNNLSFKELSLYSLIHKSILDKNHLFATFWFIFLISIALTDCVKEVSLKCAVLIPFLITVLYRFSSNLTLFISQSRFLSTFKYDSVAVFRNDTFVIIDSSDVLEGDFVLIKTDCAFPVDCLLIAIENDQGDLYVKTDTDTLEKKKSLKETQIFLTEDGMNLNELKKILETVKVLKPNSFLQKVEGKVKIKGNPRVIHTTYENFIRSGSKLVECNWALGLAVYVGKDMKAWHDFRVYTNDKHSKLDKFINFTYLINFVFISLFTVLTVILGEIYIGRQFKDSITELVFYSFMLYGNLVPITLSLVLIVLELIGLFWIKKDFKGVKVNNPKVFENLGKVEYIFTEKTGVYAENELLVQNCYLNNELFQIHNNCEKNYIEEAENSSLNSQRVTKTLSYSQFDSLKAELYSQDCPKNIKLFGFFLGICNSFISNTSLTPSNSIDMSLKKFSELLGFQIKSKAFKKCEVEFNTEYHKFTIISSIDFSNPSIFKAIIKDRTTGEIFLVFKCTDSASSIDYTTDENEPTDLKSFENLRKVTYLYKVLSKSEIKTIMKEYKLALSSTVNRKQRISSIFDTYKNELKFLACVGLENLIKPETIDLFSNLMDQGYKIWLTTRDPMESCIANAFSLKILDDNTPLITLNKCDSVKEALRILSNSLRDLERYCQDKGIIDQIGGVLYTYARPIETIHHKSGFQEIFEDPTNYNIDFDILKKIIQNDVEFVVAIDREFWLMALKYRELLRNLLIVLFCAKSVLISSVLSEMKRKVIQVVQENLGFEPVVMAVGQGSSCVRMLNEACVSVEVEGKSCLSDVCVENFADLEELIGGFGVEFEGRIRMAVKLFGFKEAMVAFLLFLFQGFCGFSGQSMISYDLIVVYELCISPLFVVLVCVLYRPVKRKRKLKSFQDLIEFIGFLASGMVNSLVIYFLVCKGIGSVASYRGFTGDYESVSLGSFVLVNLATFVQVFVVSGKMWNKIILFLAFTVLLMIFCFISTQGNLGFDYVDTDSFTHNSALWTLMILYPFISLIISIILIQSIKLIKFKNFSRLEEYLPKLNKLINDSIKCKVVNDQVKFDLDSKKLKFKDVHLEQEYLEDRFQFTLKIFKSLNCLIFIFSILNTILVEVDQQAFLDLGRFTFISSIFSFILMMISFFINDRKMFFSYEFLFLIFLICFSLSDSFIQTTSFSIGRYPVFAGLFTLVLCTEWRVSIAKCIMLYFASIIAIVYETYKMFPDDLTDNIVHWLIIKLVFTLLILISNYSQEKNRRNSFVYIKTTEIEVDKSATVLSYLLPDFVRHRVKDGMRYIAEDKGTVSVIFCDICDFETLLNLYTPQEFTNLMNDLFGTIDSICDSFGVAKIETVGKTYLACAGLKDSELGLDENMLQNTHARRAVEMALAVIKESEKITLKDGSKLKFKIGVNSGPVTAGVVGSHKPQFSLVGDTVNTASRMASTLTQSNSVQISVSTFQMLGTDVGLKFVDCVREVKGKGSMMTKIVDVQESSSKDTLSEINLSSNAKRSSIFSSPSIPTNQNLKVNDVETRKIKRSSLLANLGVHNTNELFSRQSTSKLHGIFSFLCKESEAEKKFRTDYIQEISSTQKIGLILAVICDFLLIIAEFLYILLNRHQSSLIRLIIVIVGEVFMALAIFYRRTYSKSIKYSMALSSLYSIEIFALFVENYFNHTTTVIPYMYFLYKFTLLNFYTGTLFSRNLVFNVVAISFWLSYTFIKTLSFPDISYTCAFIILTLYAVFIDEKRMRKNTILKNAAEKELKKTQQLLTQMMPPHALSTLEAGKQVMDGLKNVTLMFADIVGFTAWSSIRTPKEVVGMLSSLFTRFDKMCVENNVYKVHTIGDCYVAMGFTSDQHRNPAKEAINMIKFALSLIEVIQENNLDCGLDLGMRIGLHTGDFIGGITGTKIVRYDIYGTHVSIANKMESNGETGRIAVSETTKELIENYAPEAYQFVYAKSVQISSLGSEIKLYFLDMLQDENF